MGTVKIAQTLARAGRHWGATPVGQILKEDAAWEHGSIAVVEPPMFSLKTECVRHIHIPLRRDKFLRELVVYQEWYNAERAHTTLGGRWPRGCGYLN
jgi:hypothetical protein